MVAVCGKPPCDELPIELLAELLRRASSGHMTESECDGNRARWHSCGEKETEWGLSRVDREAEVELSRGVGQDS